MKNERDYDEDYYDDYEDGYDDEYGDDYEDEYDDDEDKPVKRRRGLTVLIRLVVCILVVALIYVWFRYRATIIMDNYPLYMINQDQDFFSKVTLHSKGDFDGITTTYDNSVEGCKKYSYIDLGYYTSSETGTRTTGYAIYIKFDSTEHAKNYLKSQTYKEDRNKHIINNYYFDEPSDLSYGWQQGIGVMFYGVLTFAHSESLGK